MRDFSNTYIFDQILKQNQNKINIIPFSEIFNCLISTFFISKIYNINYMLAYNFTYQNTSTLLNFLSIQKNILYYYYIPNSNTLYNNILIIGYINNYNSTKAYMLDTYLIE